MIFNLLCFSQTRELKFKSRLHNCVFFSSDEALQIGGLFHEGQFPYCSGYEVRRVQHFPDFNLESIFITKNIFIMKNANDFGKRVETGVDPCLPNCPLGESPTTSHCQVECWHV